MSVANADEIEDGAAINVATCWRVLHMMVTNYGNHPMGQYLIAFSMNMLHRNGYYPTVDELCRATGIPKSTVSRYVSYQLSHGYLEESIDPQDRRHRRLLQTKKGAEEMRGLSERLDQIENDVAGFSGGNGDPKDILARMEELTKQK